MITDKEIARIAKACRKNGVKRLRHGEFELEMEDRPVEKPSKNAPAIDLGEGITLPPMPPDEELLFAASPFAAPEDAAEKKEVTE